MLHLGIGYCCYMSYPETGKQAMNILNRITTYTGSEDHMKWATHEHKIKIVGVLRGADDPSLGEDDVYLDTDAESIAQDGGLTEFDRVECVVWHPKRKTWSWVTCDPRAVDLWCWPEIKAGADGCKA